MAEAEQKALRDELFEMLKRDLVGPQAPDEVLVQDSEARTGDNPLSRYLTGILYPANSVVPADEDDFANDGGESEDADSPEPPVVVTGIPKPGSIGMSFALDKSVPVELVFRYGLYTPADITAPEPAGEPAGSGKARKRRPTIRWSRQQIEIILPLEPNTTEFKQELPGSAEAEWIVRSDGGVAAVTVFLRNRNPSEEGPDRPESCLYQPEIEARSMEGGEAIMDRSRRPGQDSYDPEIQSYRLLYRDKPEFVVGHACGAGWDDAGCRPQRARRVWTDLIPRFEVPATEAKGGIGIPGLDMATLAEAPDAGAINTALLPLLDQYGDWIQAREGEIAGLPSDLRAKAREHMGDCRDTLVRIRAGLKVIENDPQVLEAFRFANRVMALQRTKSVESLNFQKGVGRVYTGDAPAWRPFQIAFLLLNLEGVVKPDSPDRDIVDLLWFPTGGGKTEAYLGLAALTLGLRRIRHMSKPLPHASGDGGVTVLMSVAPGEGAKMAASGRGHGAIWRWQ